MNQSLKCSICQFRVNAEDVRLMLWDTAGQEEFDAITKAYYRGMLDNIYNIYNI